MSGGPAGAHQPRSGPEAPAQPPAALQAPLTRRVMIANPSGFHLRPIAAFARLASSFDCNVLVAKGATRVNGKKTMELMLLGAEQGAELLLEVSGPDAPAAIEALAELLAAPAMEDDPPVPPKG